MAVYVSGWSERSVEESEIAVKRTEKEERLDTRRQSAKSQDEVWKNGFEPINAELTVHLSRPVLMQFTNFAAHSFVRGLSMLNGVADNRNVMNKRGFAFFSARSPNCLTRT